MSSFKDLFPTSDKEFNPEDSKFITTQMKQAMAQSGEPFTIRDVRLRPERVVNGQRFNAQWTYEVYMIARERKVMSFDLPTDDNGRDEQARLMMAWLKVQYSSKPVDQVETPMCMLSLNGRYYRIVDASTAVTAVPDDAAPATAPAVTKVNPDDVPL